MQSRRWIQVEELLEHDAEGARATDRAASDEVLMMRRAKGSERESRRKLVRKTPSGGPSGGRPQVPGGIVPG